MSRSTLEQVLELLINEENAKAESLLHDFVVEQARQIHEDSLNESDTVVEEELEEIEESEEVESLVDDIEEDSDEIENEEIFDDEDVSDEEAVDDLEMSDEEAPEEEIEDRVEDLESALSDLEAEFEKIMSGEDDAEDEGEEDLQGILRQRCRLLGAALDGRSHHLDEGQHARGDGRQGCAGDQGPVLRPPAHVPLEGQISRFDGNGHQAVRRGPGGAEALLRPLRRDQQGIEDTQDHAAQQSAWDASEQFCG